MFESAFKSDNERKQITIISAFNHADLSDTPRLEYVHTYQISRWHNGRPDQTPVDKIDFTGTFSKLPNLETLRIHTKYHRSTDSGKELELTFDDDFYSKLRVLEIKGHSINVDFGNFRNLFELKLTGCATEISRLPESLRHLELVNHTRLPEVLPRKLVSLNTSLNSKMKSGFLPGTLKSLRLSEYDQPIDIDVLPAGLEELYLPDFNQLLLFGSLPLTLRILEIPALDQIQHPIARGVVPASVIS